ncbi:MAG TPA: riboflavin biosynthesis protein RibF [Gaiellaceae bacterium]|nr:riboflavin biosynthesis protein RibF [Gaiellaceae bacterium]
MTTILRTPHDAEPAARAVAIGTFDGVHRGHHAVVEETLASGLRPAVVTFDPHPRAVLGYDVQLLVPLERRLELLAELGPAEILVVEFTPELARLSAEHFAESVLHPFGARLVVAGAGFRFGAGRRGDLELLARLGFEVRPVSLVDAVSSSGIRELLRAGRVGEAAVLLGRPPEVEGPVVAGDQRGGTLGFPTANLAVEPRVLVPAFGIYAGLGRVLATGRNFRTAVSIGVNPHYGGVERRVEAFLLGFAGDLYGERLRIELWERLRDERAFASETDLVAQIARDVEAARTAEPPDLEPR